MPYVTFLFTDLESSTQLYQAHADAMPRAMTRHHELLHTAIAAHSGQVFQIIGDAFHAAFPTPLDGFTAALDAQRALAREPWGELGALRVRMALHTDQAEVQPDKYTSGDYAAAEYLGLARTARLLSAAHGGQVLLSGPTAALVRDHLSSDLSLRDLGLHRVKDFQPQPIFQLVAPDLPSDFPPLKTLASLPNNLPIQLTSFIGRDREIGEVQHLLDTTRLLTLTGPGGAGKTRLSLQVAADSTDAFSDGVWFVDLAPLTEPALVPQVVATALGLHEPPGRPLLDGLQDYLRDKHLLLILDNCEHLISACAALADALLRAAPNLKILATSRQALGISGETTYPVPPLSFPPVPHLSAASPQPPALDTLTAFEAVRLFLERARAVSPHFELTRANAAAIVEICQRLDGIPLALELAAARIRGLTPEQIARRLDDRFHLLTGGSRTALARQQTLQAAIEWSYTLLSPPECLLLQRLSVFAGSWSLEAAEQVCADDALPSSDILDLLLQLVDKSLVVADDSSPAARYRFLDTLWQFARDKLFASGDDHVRGVRARHLTYFLDLAERIDRTLRGAEQESGLLTLDREADNLRAALAWAAQTRDLESELRLASSLWRYWRVRSYFTEGRRWLEDALAPMALSSAAPNPAPPALASTTPASSTSNALGSTSPASSAPSSDAPTSLGAPVSPATRARALLGAGSLANYQADYHRAAELLTVSLALHRQLGDRHGIAYSLNLLSHGQLMTGDLAAAQASIQESLTIFRQLRDTRGLGYALYFLGSMHLANGDAPAARPVLEQSLAHLERAGDRWWVGNTLIQLAWCLIRLDESASAQPLLSQAVDIFSTFGDTRGAARALLYTAEAQARRGDFDAARSIYRQGLQVFRAVGDKWWGTVCLEGLAYIAAHQSDAPRVALLLGAADRLHELLGAPLLPIYRPAFEAGTARARALLGEAAFIAHWNAGRNLTYEQAVESALADVETP